jgi:hypothetical protein
MHVHQIHDNVPLKVVENVIMFFSTQLLIVKLHVLSPQLLAMDDCFFKGKSSLNPNDVTEGIKHVHQIHSTSCHIGRNYLAC